MLKSSPTLRVLMAAGMYLLLMWGYVILQTPQLYAVLAALIMCIALLFWVHEARAAQNLADSRIPEPGDPSQSAENPLIEGYEPSVSASLARLDALKDELTQQYAQFGKDQSILNSTGLGTWQKKQGRAGGESE